MILCHSIHNLIPVSREPQLSMLFSVVKAGQKQPYPQVFFHCVLQNNAQINRACNDSNLNCDAGDRECLKQKRH